MGEGEDGSILRRSGLPEPADVLTALRDDVAPAGAEPFAHRLLVLGDVGGRRLLERFDALAEAVRGEDRSHCLRVEARGLDLLEPAVERAQCRAVGLGRA